MFSGLSRAAALAAGALVFACPVQAGNFDDVLDNAVAAWTLPDGSTPEAEDARAQAAYVLGKELFTLYHEFGHALIDGYKLKIIVQEEAVADAFAGTYMIGAEPDPVRDALAMGAVRAYMDRAERIAENGIDYSEPHLFDAQRGFNAICMFIGGGSEDRFGAVADEFVLPASRREHCGYEAQQVGSNWAGALPDAAFVAEGKTSTNTITITYDDPPENMVRAAALLKESGVLEAFKAEIEALFELPRPIKLTVEDCGDTPNLIYYDDKAQIQVCYQYLEYYRELGIERRFTTP
jgi:hypothetical protein